MPDLAEIKRVMEEADCIATPAEVEAALSHMAGAITERLGDADPLVFTIMNGGLVLAGQLLPRLRFPLQLDYLHATRYADALTGSKDLQWRVKPSQALAGRCVLVLDDILDEGHTLLAVIEALRAAGAEQVFNAVLVDKRHERKARPGLRPDFFGIEAPDRYLFGCGMDYKGYWRNAPGIYALKGA